MVNLKSFTKALSLFCLAVFIYTIMPEKISWVSLVFKYVIIIYIIILLIMYNKILSEFSNNSNQQNIIESDLVDFTSLNNEAFQSSFKDLSVKLLLLVKSINSSCTGAIYILDPDKQSFVLQTDDENKFLSTIAITNEKIKKFIFHKKNVASKR